MPLEKQLVPVLLGPLDGKTDPKSAPTGTLTVAENVYQQRKGEWRKREGRASIGTTAVFTGKHALATPWQIVQHGDSLVSLSTFSYWGIIAPLPIFQLAHQGWNTTEITYDISEGQLQSFFWGPISAQRWPVLGDEGQNVVPDCAVAGDVALVAWEIYNAATQAYSVVACLYDRVKNVVINTRVYTGSLPRCEVISGRYLMLFYKNGTGHYVIRWDTSTHATIAAGPSTALTLSNAATCVAFDVIQAPAGWGADVMVIAGVIAAGTDVRCWAVNCAANPPTESTTALLGKGSDLAIGWLKNYGGFDQTGTRLLLGCADATDGVVVHSVTSALAVGESNIMDGVNKANVRNITGSTIEMDSDDAITYHAAFFILYEVGVGVAPGHSPEWYTATWFASYRNSGGALIQGGVFVRSCGLRSKVFAHGDPNYDGSETAHTRVDPFLVWLAYPQAENMTQPTYFLYPIHLYKGDSIYPQA